jgi:hypothetical protein
MFILRTNKNIFMVDFITENIHSYIKYLTWNLNFEIVY